MSEGDLISGSADGPTTRETLVADLRELGLRARDSVIVHASMRSIGWVVGGPVTVIQALDDVIGPQGTLVIPTHSSDYSEPAYWVDPAVPADWHPMIRDAMPAFDPDVTPSRGMGRIAECFRCQPGVLRSDHPQLSFAARGPLAAAILADQSLHSGLGEGSPLARLYDRHAKICLLGVGFESCTALHLAEHRADPYRPTLRPDGAAMRVEGQRRWHRFATTDYSSDDFAALQADYEARGEALSTGLTGAAATLVVPMRELVDFAGSWLASNRSPSRTTE